MDPITHGLLGATVAKAVTWRRVPTGAAIIGALAAMAPDLDVLIWSASDPTVGWQYHRHLTHALLAIPIGGLLCALPFLMLRQYKQFRGGVIMAAIIGYATHTMLDSFTTYGTQQYLPWSDLRVTWDAMPIVDPLYSGILALGLWVSARSRRITPIVWSIALALLYTTFGFWQHARAEGMQRELIALRQAKQPSATQVQQARVMPAPGWLVYWRSVYLADGKLYADGIRLPWIGAATVLEGGSAKTMALHELPPAAQSNAETVRQFKIFDWFTGGYLTRIDDNPNIIGDQRIANPVESLTPMWGLQFDEAGKAHHWSPGVSPATGSVNLLRGLLFGDARYRTLAELQGPPASPPTSPAKGKQK